MTDWLKRQLDQIRADAETWPAWKRREVGLMPKERKYQRGIESLDEVQLSTAEAGAIDAAIQSGSARPKMLPKQAPPIIRPAPPRWEVRDGQLCEIVRTDRCFREVETETVTAEQREIRLAMQGIPPVWR